MGGLLVLSHLLFFLVVNPVFFVVTIFKVLFVRCSRPPAGKTVFNIFAAQRRRIIARVARANDIFRNIDVHPSFSLPRIIGG
jgi:hypothetical protein